MDFKKQSTQELQAIINEAKNLSDEEVSQLSQPEMDRLTGMKAELDTRKPTQVEAGVRGAAQGATLGFADEAEAAYRAAETSAKEIISGVDNNISFNDQFNNELQNARAANRAAEQAYPATFTTAEVAGSLIAPGAVIGKAAKGATAAARIGKAALQGAALGGASALGKAENKMSGEAAAEVATGAAVGGLVGGAVSSAGELIAKAAPDAAMVWKRMLGLNSASKSKDLQRYLGATGQTENDFFNKMVNHKVGDQKLVSLTDSMDDIAAKSKQALDEADVIKNALLDKADLGATDIEAKSMFMAVKNKLSSDIDNALVPEVRANLTKVLDQIQGVEQNLVDSKIAQSMAKGAKEAAEVKISLKDMYEVKKQLQQAAYDNNGLSTSAKEAYKHASSKFNNLIDDFITQKELAGKLPEGMAKEFKDARITQSNLIKFANAAQDAATANANRSISPFSEMFKVLATGSAATMAGVAPTTAVGIAGSIRAASKIPGVDNSMALMLSKLSNKIENGGTGASKIVQVLGNAAVNNVDAFKKAVSSEYAKSVLEENPIERNVTDVVNKQTSILAVADYLNPQLAGQLRDAIESNNEDLVASSMERLAKDPALSKYFAKGQGFNGKVTDPEDKASMLKTLEMAPISHVQRLQLKKNLINNNIVPQVNVEQPADTASQFLGRDKKRPQY